MRAAAHWILFALSTGAGVSAFAFSGTTGVPIIVSGWTFLSGCVALAIVDMRQRSIPAGSPRSIAWLLTALTAAFLPLLSIAGAWSPDSESLLVLPGVIGSYAAPVTTPWLVSVGPQPTIRQGRFSPVLLSWLAVALNYAVSSG